jgi:dTDP-4-amino-4,6-dideoxygalactose transaminase
MIHCNAISVTRSSTIQRALEKLDRAGSGLLLLTDEQGRFERTVTDGDLRRLLLKGCAMQDTLSDLPSIASVVLGADYSRQEALALMVQHSINHLPVVDAQGLVLEVLERKTIDQQVLLSTPHMGSWEKEYVDEAFRTNWIAPLGPNVDAFEREIAEMVGAKHAAALSSGTAAIHLALCMLGVGRGDTVFCSTLTFAASANPIVYQGAEPVFIDSEPTSWNMSPVALEKAFAEASHRGRLPKAVIVVNLYGQSADMDALGAICEHYGVPIVEDAAESLGARYKGRMSGTLGAMGIYSFNGNKIITTSGGGMLVSDNKEFIERARFLATQARDPAPYYQHSVVGFNYRMSNILAGVGRGQLKVLDERVRARRAVFEIYRKELADLECIEWMPEPEWSYSTHWLSACTIRSDTAIVNSFELIKRLSADMIEARPLWKPMHLQPVFENCLYFSHGEDSVSDHLFEQGICLPSGSNMSEETLHRVISLLRRLLCA